MHEDKCSSYSNYEHYSKFDNQKVSKCLNSMLILYFFETNAI